MLHWHQAARHASRGDRHKRRARLAIGPWLVPPGVEIGHVVIGHRPCRDRPARAFRGSWRYLPWHPRCRAGEPVDRDGCRSGARPSDGPPAAPESHSIARVIATDTAEVFSAISRAMPIAASSNSSRPADGAVGTSPRSIAPRRRSNMRPVMHHSSAVCMPTNRGRNPRARGGFGRDLPPREHEAVFRALSLSPAGCRTGVASLPPMPTATRCTPIKGFFESNSRRVRRPIPPSRTRSSDRSSTGLGSEKTCPPSSGVRSAPAQKARSP